jgi:Fe-S-cluster containining protein
MNIDKKAQNLAIRARDSLSNYCFSECKAYCCRSGHLLLTAKEADSVMKVNKSELNLLNVSDNVEGIRYVLDLSRNDTACPNLKDFKCIEHKNTDRPAACQEFPLFIRKDKVVFVTFRCPGAKENKLYPFLARFKKMGYDIVYDQEN